MTSGGSPKTAKTHQWAHRRWLGIKLAFLSDLTGAGVLAIESGDEEDWIAAGVDLVVDRPLREEGTLAFGQGIVDETSPVLFNESSFHLSVDEVKDLGCSGVGVRGVHATWSIPMS